MIIINSAATGSRLNNEIIATQFQFWQYIVPVKKLKRIVAEVRIKGLIRRLINASYLLRHLQLFRLDLFDRK